MDALQRTFRTFAGQSNDDYKDWLEKMSWLRGMEQRTWNMASEQRTEPQESAVQTVSEVRLRQVSPVIADRVTDLKRSVPRGADKEKWYHGLRGSSSRTNIYKSAGGRALLICLDNGKGDVSAGYPQLSA